MQSKHNGTGELASTVHFHLFHQQPVTSFPSYAGTRSMESQVEDLKKQRETCDTVTSNFTNQDFNAKVSAKAFYHLPGIYFPFRQCTSCVQSNKSSPSFRTRRSVFHKRTNSWPSICCCCCRFCYFTSTSNPELKLESSLKTVGE